MSLTKPVRTRLDSSCTIKGTNGGRRRRLWKFFAAPFPLAAPWHLDVSGVSGRLWILLTTARGRGFDAELLWGWSGDSELSWNVEGKPLRLYYSAMAGDGTWHVAALDLGAPPPYETGTEGN